MDSDYSVGDLVYDANMYDGLNTSLNDLEFYKKWLPENKEASVLELCCGTGRLTIPIAKEGYEVWGVDYTSSMLDEAIIKASKANVRVNFIHADMRSFNLPIKFDFIFIPFNSIHHLYKNEDLFKVFDAVRNHLKKGGLFLLDCYNPNIKYVTEGEKEQMIIAKYTTEDKRDVRIEQNMKYERGTQINRIKWNYFINNEFHSVQNLDMRLYYPQELDSYFQWKGFTILHKFGNFQEEKFHNDSEKQIFVCE